MKKLPEIAQIFYIALVLFAPAFAEELPDAKFENAGALNKPVEVGHLPKVIDESSGLMKSKKYPDRDVFWTHNDSGDSARIFAVNTKGDLLRTVNIPGAENIDWEEITMDDVGRLIICDCGDNHRNNNGGRRKGIVLYRLPEPDAFNPDEKIPEPETFRFHFPDDQKIHDAEGVFARAGAAYLFTKQAEGASCYKLTLPEKAPAENVAMVRVAKTKTFNVVTGAALSPDGKRLALINYLSVMVIEMPEPFEKLKPDASGDLPIFSFPRKTVNCFLGQTEAVAWDKDELVLTTEGGGIFRVKK